MELFGKDGLKIVNDIMQSEYHYGDLKGYMEWKKFLGFLEKQAVQIYYIKHYTKKTYNTQTIKGNQAERNYCLSGSLVTYQCGKAAWKCQCSCLAGRFA